VLLAWTDALTAGSFALGGTAIGLLGGGVLQIVLDGRREAAELRQAKRLVATELRVALVGLDGLIARRTFPVPTAEAEYFADLKGAETLMRRA
jgi:hypothetical protein